MIAEYELRSRSSTVPGVSSWAGRLAVPFTVVGLSALIEAARFGLKTPSLIDDWFGVAYSRHALHALIHGHYLSAGSDFQGRYRPAYSAVWAYTQWHLLGAPSIIVSEAWGMARTAAFLIAILLLAKWLLGRELAVPRPLLLLPPLAVALTPNITVDLARFGPGEPMMVSGLVLGLALLGKGVRELLSSPRRRLLGATCVAGGYVIYLVGVYSKESAVALLAFVPFFLVWLRPWLRIQFARSRWSRTFLSSLGISLVLPLIHLGIRLALAVLSRASPWPNAHLTIGQKIWAAFSPLLGMPGVMGTWLWLIACQVAIVVTIVLARRSERDASLLAGVLISAFFMSAIPLARGPMPTYYYIPWIVAVAAVAFRAVAYGNRRVALSVVALVALLVPFGTPSALAEWTQIQRSGAEAINLSKSVVAAGCPLYLANFDIEQRVAVPLLFRFGHTTAITRCSPGTHVAYAVSWKNKPLAPDFARQCRSRWRELMVEQRVGFYRCASLRPATTLDQFAASGEPTVTVVRIRLPRVDPPPARIFQPLRATH